MLGSKLKVESCLKRGLLSKKPYFFLNGCHILKVLKTVELLPLSYNSDPGVVEGFLFLLCEWAALLLIAVYSPPSILYAPFFSRHIFITINILRQADKR